MMTISMNVEMLQTTKDKIETFFPNMKLVLSKVLKVDEKFIKIKRITPSQLTSSTPEHPSEKHLVEIKVKVFGESEKDEVLSYMNPKTFIEEVNIKSSEDVKLMSAGIFISSSTDPTCDGKDGNTFM